MILLSALRLSFANLSLFFISLELLNLKANLDIPLTTSSNSFSTQWSLWATNAILDLHTDISKWLILISSWLFRLFCMRRTLKQLRNGPSKPTFSRKVLVIESSYFLIRLLKIAVVNPQYLYFLNSLRKTGSLIFCTTSQEVQHERSRLKSMD